MPSAFGLPIKAIDRYVAPPVMTLLTTLTASGSSSLQYTGFSSASYKKYRMIFAGLLPVDNGVNWEVRASTNSGSTYGALWEGVIISPGNVALVPTNTQQGGGVTRFPVALACTNNTSTGWVYGEADWAYNPVSGNRSALIGLCGTRRYDYAYPGPNISHAIFDTATEVNTLNFSFSTGNIVSGTVKIYGIT